MNTVAVLFARKDSIYKTMPDCDVYDIDRDARKWPGGTPIVAHPPCRAWGGLKHMAKPRPDEKALAPWAVSQIRKFGGVLEHPRRSALWPELGLPAPGAGKDSYGGWTLGVSQKEFGHLAEKKTLLYIVGVEPKEIPPLPLALHEAPLTIGTSGRRRDGKRKAGREVPKWMREATPPMFARWLVDLAKRTVKP